MSWYYAGDRAICDGCGERVAAEEPLYYAADGRHLCQECAP